MRWLVILLLTGCASKFAPVVSRPDNLVIECETKCKFNIPMNTEIVVAKNTNGYDMGIAALKQIPFIGALALSWKSMDVAEDIAEEAIESFNRGKAQPLANIDNSVSTVTTGDTNANVSTSTSTDSSGSGNTTSGDVANTTGDTAGGDLSGGDMDKSSSSVNTTYSNANNSSPVACTGAGCL